MQCIIHICVTFKEIKKKIILSYVLSKMYFKKNQKMRLECEFSNCSCCKHVGAPDTPCGICGHGACWHHLDTSQFDSPRDSAHKPRYIPVTIAIFVPTLPQVPPLPEVTPRFCRGELPV